MASAPCATCLRNVLGLEKDAGGGLPRMRLMPSSVPLPGGGGNHTQRWRALLCRVTCSLLHCHGRSQAALALIFLGVRMAGSPNIMDCMCKLYCALKMASSKCQGMSGHRGRRLNHTKKNVNITINSLVWNCQI